MFFVQVLRFFVHTIHLTYTRKGTPVTYNYFFTWFIKEKLQLHWQLEQILIIFVHSCVIQSMWDYMDSIWMRISSENLIHFDPIICSSKHQLCFFLPSNEYSLHLIWAGRHIFDKYIFADRLFVDWIWNESGFRLYCNCEIYCFFDRKGL